MINEDLSEASLERWTQLKEKYRQEYRNHLTYVEQVYRQLIGVNAMPTVITEKKIPLKKEETLVDPSKYKEMDSILRTLSSATKKMYRRILKEDLDSSAFLRNEMAMDYVLESERLNRETSDTIGFTFKSPNGATYFQEDGFRGCCGIAILSTFRFGKLKDHHKFYDDFKKYIIESDHGNLGRSNILFADATGGEDDQHVLNKPCIYSMCKYWGLKESGFQMYNLRTTNPLSLYVLKKVPVAYSHRSLPPQEYLDSIDY